MGAEDLGEEATITKRRYTGATRGDATAGFKIDWPGLARHYLLVAEAWDDDTHTLTVMLKPLPSPPPAEPSDAARRGGSGTSKHSP